MPTVAVTDYTFSSLDFEESILKPLGAAIIGGQCKTPDAVMALVGQADAVITQFAPVNAAVIAAMQRAKVIVRYGIGVDNVDLEAARSRGIPVCNVPDYCIDEVADHTLAFVLAATRQIVPNCLKVRSGQWGLAVPLDQMKTLRDLTVGVVGFGRIGREVAARLRAFKSSVLVHDPVVAPDAIVQAGCRPATWSQLLAESDVITLHCPSTPQTRGLVNQAAINAMKPGVILINVARGDIVDLEALTGALESGHVSVAALDVFQPEPIPAQHPILAQGNAIVAAHVASTSVRAVRTLRETAARIAAMALRGEPLPNVVNGVTS